MTILVAVRCPIPGDGTTEQLCHQAAKLSGDLEESLPRLGVRGISILHEQHELRHPFRDDAESVGCHEVAVCRQDAGRDFTDRTVPRQKNLAVPEEERHRHPLQSVALADGFHGSLRHVGVPRIEPDRVIEPGDLNPHFGLLDDLTAEFSESSHGGLFQLGTRELVLKPLGHKVEVLPLTCTQSFNLKGLRSDYAADRLHSPR